MTEHQTSSEKGHAERRAERRAAVAGEVARVQEALAAGVTLLCADLWGPHQIAAVGQEPGMEHRPIVWIRCVHSPLRLWLYMEHAKDCRDWDRIVAQIPPTEKGAGAGP